jgi:hypothetical protein
MPADYYRIVVLPKHKAVIFPAKPVKNKLLHGKVMMRVSIPGFYV